ncbi:restriction endonuclease [Candidatus Bathyarchaeota archaeon]|jgi:Holliday junction resolvase-like predicted endonuclease|nr:restriction endonuclease [Candidatus Bathyarchaeota archaeon]
MTSTTLHIALLHETRKDSVCQAHDLTAGGRICASLVGESVQKLEEEDAVSVSNEEIRVNPAQRLRIAQLAVAAGADPERVARELRWQEFETFVNQVLSRDGYETRNHFVFKASGQKFEIDVMGAKEPVVLCVDCKHWHHGWAPSRIAAAARHQLLRVLSLSQVLPACRLKFSFAGWESARFLPVVLALADVSLRLVDGVPIVPVLRLRSFLAEINPWVEKLRFVDVRIP